MGKVNGWLITREMAQRRGVGYWFFKNWILKAQNISYPEKFKPKEGVHYMVKTHQKGGQSGRHYFWDSEIITQRFIAELAALHQQRKREALKRPRKGKYSTGQPKPEDNRIEVFCWQRGIYMPLENCQQCWIGKTESERPTGYQWEEHCQRGVSVAHWREGITVIFS